MSRVDFCPNIHQCAAMALSAQRVRTLGAYLFYSCLMAAAAAMLYAGMTRNFAVGVKWFFGAIWVGCVSVNAVILYTGEIRGRRRLYLSRATNAAGYYCAILVFAAATLGASTFLFWRALRHG